MMTAHTSHFTQTSHFAQTGHDEFSSGLWQGPRFDLVQISTIAIGIVVMTTLAMMF